MADQKTAAEVAQEREAALADRYQTEFDESQKAAVDARANEPDTAETNAEYYDRVQAASLAGVFGDTDTTAGASASGTDVPVADNEAATKAVAAADDGEDDGTTDEARRQVGPATADEVDEGAAEQHEELGASAPEQKSETEEAAEENDRSVDEQIDVQQKERQDETPAPEEAPAEAPQA